MFNRANFPRSGALALGLAAALALAGTARAGDDTPQAGDVIENVPGFVQHVREDWYGLVPDSDPGTRYAPDSLPEEFRVDGLRVRFSGIVGEIPPNIRMWGTPLQLTHIERLEDSGPDGGPPDAPEPPETPAPPDPPAAARP